MTAVIETRELTKIFEESRALDGLTWSVQEASIHALLGPNGAGKTTTMKILFDITHPTSGEARVLGLNSITDSAAIRQTVAFIPEDKLLYDAMSIDRFLSFYGSFFPEWSEQIANKILYRWNLAAARKIKTLSKGERAKLLLIAALSRKPKMLILDEPTDGLDPVTVEEVFATLTQWIASEGRTVVIATHRLEEVERISDAVTIIHHGKALLSGNLDGLRGEWKVIELAGEIPMQTVQNWEEVAAVSGRGWVTRVVTKSAPATVLEKLKQYRPANISVHDMNLREIYLTTIRPGGSDYYDFLENLV